MLKMSENKTIVVFMCKSERKNSKFMSKSICKYDSLYDKNNIYDLCDFIVACKKLGYRVMRMSCIDNAYMSRHFYSGFNHSGIEQQINEIFHHMEYLNLKRFDFTIQELHNDPNIRYHIGKYYHE